MNYDKGSFPTEGLVRINQVSDYLAISKSSIWSGLRKGTFPEPLRLNGITAWRATEIRKLAGEVH